MRTRTLIEAERIFEAREALAASLARDVADELSRAIEAKGRATLAVSGGTTPKLFFEKLSMIDIPWSRVSVTLVDERQVPESSERSNARLVRAHLLQNKAAAARFVPLVGNPDAENIPAFDVAVLGMGNDGHTASFFPGAPGLEQALSTHGHCAWVRPDAQRNQAQHARLTLSLSTLMAAQHIYLPLAGAAKHAVFQQARQTPTDQLPVSLLLHRREQPVSVWLSP